jgi:hypothetical protein
VGGSGGRDPGPDERRRAAERLLVANPHWSDRAIGEACGLSSKLVAASRRRLTGHLPPLEARVGRDGRLRPLDATVGRRRAAELLAERPAASLREVALAAGVSPGTVRDVRERLRDGRPPVVAPPPRARPAARSASGGGRPSRPPLPLQGTAGDARAAPEWSDWLAARLVTPGELERLVDAVPLSRIYVVADLARHVARHWDELAAAVDRRADVRQQGCKNGGVPDVSRA